MKKYFFAASLCISQLLGAQTSAPEPSRYISKQAQSASVPLNNYERCFYFRLPNGLVDQFQTDMWDGTQFQYDNTRFYIYDPSEVLTGVVTRKWDATNGYTDFARESYTYDPDGNRLSESYERLNSSSNQFELERTVSFTYSATGKVLERTTFQYFNSQSFGSRIAYTYDADDREETLTYQNYYNNAWNNQQRNTYLYNDSDHKVDVLFSDVWSETVNDWTLANRTSYSYQPTVTTALTEVFSNGTWSNYSSSTTNYNADNQVTSYLVSQYTPQGLNPGNGYQIDYNPDKSLQQFRYYYTDFSNNVYFQSLQIDYDYDTYTGTQSTDLEADIQVFPNPATDFLRIQSADHTEGMRYAVHDTQGQVLAQGSVRNGSSTIDCHAFAPGAYFLMLSQNGRSKTVAFIRN
jgi:Secretion system C-terminal sorting domain